MALLRVHLLYGIWHPGNYDIQEEIIFEIGLSVDLPQPTCSNLNCVQVCQPDVCGGGSGGNSSAGGQQQ